MTHLYLLNLDNNSLLVNDYSGHYFALTSNDVLADIEHYKSVFKFNIIKRPRLIPNGIEVKYQAQKIPNLTTIKEIALQELEKGQISKDLEEYLEFKTLRRKKLTKKYPWLEELIHPLNSQQG